MTLFSVNVYSSLVIWYFLRGEIFQRNDFHNIHSKISRKLFSYHVQGIFKERIFRSFKYRKFLVLSAVKYFKEMIFITYTLIFHRKDFHIKHRDFHTRKFQRGLFHIILFLEKNVWVCVCVRVWVSGRSVKSVWVWVSAHKLLGTKKS